MKKFEDYLSHIQRGKYLSATQMSCLMQKISEKETSSMQIAALLSMLSIRGENFEELLGAVQFLRNYSVAVNCDDECTIDICGTGGDGANTFNISTAAALVIASSGKVTVAKHGGGASSSLCGSSDVISELNILHARDPKHAEYMLKKHRFAFLLAPRFNPILQKIGTVRRELKIKTLFNVLGPLLNPVRIKRQVMGIFNIHHMENIVRVMQANGINEAIVMHSRDGLDELSLAAPTDYMHLKNGEITQSVFDPKYYGLHNTDPNAIQGSGPQANATIICDIFSGTKGAPRDIVVFNAALGLMVGGAVSNMGDGLDLARECIDSGKTLNLLNELRKELNNHEI